jgi:hypothetical protein
MKRYSFIVPILILFSVSCKNLVDGINIDPGSPSDAPAAAMLTGVMVSNMVLQEGEVARIAGLWSGYFRGVQQQYQSFDQYIVTARIFDDNWQRVYTSAFKNIKLLKEKARAVNNIRLMGVAQVVEANVMGTASALWGDIPYVEAANPTFLNPTYNSQLENYGRIQSLLDSAITNINSTAFESFATQDIHFAGNTTKWIQTAYTLKARYFMHTGEYSKALAAATLGINSNANSWMAPHATSGRGAYNLYYQFVVQDRPGWMVANGSFAYNLLNPSKTPNRGNAKTIERARFNYLFTGTGALNTSTNGFFGQASPFPLAGFAENLLILAEAETRLNGFDKGLVRLNAYRAYMAAGGYIGSTYTTAGNIKYDPYVLADFNAGGMENLPATSSLSKELALLREILEERYITFIGQIEGFNDVRRVFKEIEVRVPVTPNTGTNLPQRFLYPQIEVDLNTSTPNPIPSLFTVTTVNK